MKQFILSVCAVICCSCAGFYDFVTYDYDKKQDYNTYQTYNFHSEQFTEELSPLDLDRWRDSLLKGLEKKGLQPSDRPDILVKLKARPIYVEHYVQVINDTTKLVNRIERSTATALASDDEPQYFEISMFFFDARRDALLWQSAYNYKFYPDSRPEFKDSYFRLAIQYMLQNYPPPAP